MGERPVARSTWLAVIVTQAEIDLIRSDMHRRRMMRLPARRGPRARCPLEKGHAYRLATRPFEKAQLTITVVREPQRVELATLSEADAKREGYFSITGALEGWKDRHGIPEPDQLVWVVEFVCGDESDFIDQDRPVFLRRRARDGGMRADYTTRPDEAVIEGGLAVEVATVPGASERARVVALAARQAPARAQVDELLARVGELRASLTSMKARNRLRIIEKELASVGRQVAKLATDLPVSEVLDSAESPPCFGSNTVAPTAPAATDSPSPKAAVGG